MAQASDNLISGGLPYRPRQATRSIARDFPELVPATEHIPELEAVSAAATAAFSAHYATIGQLMSFGTITPPAGRAHLARQVVALATGEGGNILRLQLLSKEKRGWGTGPDSDSLCYLECLSWKGDCGFWNRDATAIQQVCFAQSEKPGSFLAVRLPRRVALFRPVYHDRPTAATKSRLYDLPPSVIEIRPFHSVWTEDTGSIPHADVSFNPHYQRQFAIIDQKSSWSVWDIEGTRRNYLVRHVASGNMSIEENRNEEQAGALGYWKEDGWARIIWVGDANTVLICSRKRIELINLKPHTRSLRMPQVIDWHSTKSTPNSWILDVKRHPLLDEKHFFVLTSARLFLFSLPCLSDGPRANHGNTDADIILSWTHFRGTEDMTLQLYAQSVSTEGISVPQLVFGYVLTPLETVVFIYSRVNALITVYRLVNQTSTAAPYRSFGPTTLRLDKFEGAQGSKFILNFNIARLDFKDSTGASRGVGDDYRDRGVQFYQLSIFFNDHSVAQTMLCSLDHNFSDGVLDDVMSTSWATTIKPMVFRSKDVVDSDDDDFVEPDGVTGSKEPLLNPSFQQPKCYQQVIGRIQRDVFNFTGLYEAISLNKPFPLHHTSDSPEIIDMATLVEEIKWRLDREENVEPFALGTLQEYAEAIVTVDDIDDASAKLQEICLTDGRASSLQLRRIASDFVLGFSAEESQNAPSLSSIYDLVLQNWLVPLPGIVPARIRQNKERMARRLAIGVTLASTRVRPLSDVVVGTITQPDPRQDIAVARSSSPPQYSSQSDRQSQSSQAVHSASSPSSTRLDDPLTRLSKHLHMTTITPPEVPPSINQVLSHWQVGADPSSYDWEASERAFAEELELMQEEGTQKRRERARRKKERQAKRQKKEDQLFTGRVESGKVESQPQLLRSSPGPASPTISSQVPAPNQYQPIVVQSQVEPGRHGGRLMKKKKVKTRMSGF
ncbi:uncharacterized protein N0V89_007121 [Didymosphaeria variabile]|uniref:RNA polymerase I-specific transcription initiation factor RRN6-like protein n=1 Tax=Didymosphaeria variabile TaxID=1932322 RepID=A0A9W8XIA3_9PLEO|nr:uncharacterized protein N0V89_007121 [Didymosphaeria variabile]KAJ4351778.1 hypothetical protein N0V89_007121 [Didymosphaeria variabile]